MKKLIQLRISQREVDKTSLEEAILLSLENFLLGSVETQWSATRQYLLLKDRYARIKALSFEKQWKTLMHQVIDGRRLKCYVNIPAEFLKKEYKV